jgi:hypothetical protein
LILLANGHASARDFASSVHAGSFVEGVIAVGLLAALLQVLRHFDTALVTAAPAFVEACERLVDAGVCADCIDVFATRDFAGQRIRPARGPTLTLVGSTREPASTVALLTSFATFDPLLAHRSPAFAIRFAAIDSTPLFCEGSRNEDQTQGHSDRQCGDERYSVSDRGNRHWIFLLSL